MREAYHQLVIYTPDIQENQWPGSFGCASFGIVG